MTETPPDPRYPVQAPGWAALDRALGMLYPGQQPHQFTSQRAYDLEGRSPLPAVAAYEATGPDHWHLVSYGLTELFEKSSPDAERSGFGFELTLRLPRMADEDRPPMWTVQLLQALGHYVLSGHGPLDSGHIIDLGAPICPPLPSPEGERPSALHGVVCVPDPQMGKIDTDHGSVLFLQLF
ncbi:MAG: suppressor of fused domain protein, partial [Deltaproteobacteria bacterium]|nr:suppressor of fused domain protein [Deltaproteobacteria bacterium]